MNEKLLETINSAVYVTRRFCSNGVEFSIGFVDKFPNLWLACTVDKVSFRDGKTNPAIILSNHDIKELTNKYGTKRARDIIKFAIGHELGHLRYWKDHPGSEKNPTLDQEVYADMFSMKHTGTSKKQYKFISSAITEGLNEMNIAAMGGRPLCALINGFNVVILTHRRNKAIREIKKDGIVSGIPNHELVFDQLADIAMIEK